MGVYRSILSQFITLPLITVSYTRFLAPKGFRSELGCPHFMSLWRYGRPVGTITRYGWKLNTFSSRQLNTVNICTYTSAIILDVNIFIYHIIYHIYGGYVYCSTTLEKQQNKTRIRELVITLKLAHPRGCGLRWSHASPQFFSAVDRRECGLSVCQYWPCGNPYMIYIYIYVYVYI